MALTPERIRELWENYSPTKGIESFARSIEAEVRKDDEALIRQMLAAMDEAQTEARWGNAYGRCDTTKFDKPMAAARARLEKAP